jgi:BlaI family transcriptional regulator, penicillinase repressor
MSQLPQPTDAELAILRILWQDGPSTVRHVVQRLQGLRKSSGNTELIGYTTALKQMQIMTTKGLLMREESSRSHVYRPTATEERTLRQVVTDLLDRAFGGSTEKLLLSALSARRATPREIAEIRQVLADFEASQRGNKS